MDLNNLMNPPPERVRVLRVQSRICIGGPALNTILLSAHLDANRYQTLLVGGRLDPGEKPMLGLAETKGVAVHMIEEMGRSVKWRDDWRAFRRLVRLIRLYRPHILHTHTAKAGALGRLAGLFCRVPIRIHTFHGHVFHGYFSAPISRLIVWTERLLAWTSHAIIAISPRQQVDLTERFRIVAGRKCHLVRLGFELTPMTQGVPGRFRASLGVAGSTFLAAILARLVPIKNHHLLLHAIAAWHRDQPQLTPREVRFAIVGDGELRDQLETLAESLDIAPFLIFTGWRRDTADIYADIDLNILVSKNEGTPVTLIEGLACGVPILATDAGGIRDFAGPECGAILPIDVSPEELAGHLQASIALGANKRLAESIRAPIAESFDVKRLVSDMDCLYQSLLSSRGLRPPTDQS